MNERPKVYQLERGFDSETFQKVIEAAHTISKANGMGLTMNQLMDPTTNIFCNEGTNMYTVQPGAREHILVPFDALSNNGRSTNVDANVEA